MNTNKTNITETIEYQYQEAISYLESYTPRRREHKFTADWGLSRIHALLTLLGNPQEKYKSIHIAGTSGKGSTCYAISTLLTKHGFKTGLTLSPHIIDLRERTQINTTIIDKETFVQNLNEIKNTISEIENGKFGKLTYFEICMALAFYTFAKEHVDYAIIETGLGGMFDGSNSIIRKDKMCVLTRIGYDHTEILGNTLALIAEQKSGIIHNGNDVVALYQSKSIREMFEKASIEHDASLHYVTLSHSTKNITITEEGTYIDYTYKGLQLQKLHIKAIGIYQAENISIALGAVYELSIRDTFSLQEGVIRNALGSLHIPGRLDIIKVGKKKIIIDGAHNPQKLKALIKTLTTLYPKKQFIFLLSFRNTKKYYKMLQSLVPFASIIIITDILDAKQDIMLTSDPAKRVVKALETLHYSNYKIIHSSADAITYALSLKETYIVATSSLYFASDMYSLLSSRVAAAFTKAEKSG